MKRRTTRLPWRGVVVHLSKQVHQSRVKISHMTSVKVVDYASSGDEGDEATFEAAFKSFDDHMNNPIITLRSKLKKQLLNLDVVINALKIIKRCSAVKVSKLEASFLSCFGHSLRPTGCPNSTGNILTCLLHENCIKQESRNGELWVFRRMIFENQYLKRHSVKQRNVTVLPMTEGLYSKIQTGWSIRGIVADPNPITATFHLLPLNCVIQFHNITRATSVKQSSGYSGSRGIYTVSVDGHQEQASIASLVMKGLCKLRLNKSGRMMYVVTEDLQICPTAEQFLDHSQELSFSALGRLPYDGEIVTLKVIGRIHEKVQVVVNEEKLISKFKMTINHEGAAKHFNVRAVRVNESLYFACQDLPMIAFPENVSSGLVQYSNLSKFYNSTPVTPDMSVKLTGHFKELVAVSDTTLANLRFIPAHVFAKVLLAYGNQPDELIWGLLLC